MDDGQENLMKVVGILKAISEQEKRCFNVKEMLNRGKENLVKMVSDQICQLKEISDQKKECIQLLEEVIEWWGKMAQDREKLLLTIAEMELEKQEPKDLSAKEIYGIKPN